MRALLLATVDELMLVVTIRGVTLDDAAEIWAEIEDQDAELDIDGVGAAVITVTGQRWTRVTRN